MPEQGQPPQPQASLNDVLKEYLGTVGGLYRTGGAALVLMVTGGLLALLAVLAATFVYLYDTGPAPPVELTRLFEKVLVYAFGFAGIGLLADLLEKLMKARSAGSYQRDVVSLLETHISATRAGDEEQRRFLGSVVGTTQPGGASAAPPADSDQPT
jgi:hypothetical protein